MPDPVVSLEVEFTAGVWTNVGSYLREGTTKRGRAKATGKVPPGTATFVLQNHDRRFDPEYSANISPGNLTPGKNIRMKAVYNAVAYPVFTGQIDRIIQSYDGPNSAVAVLDCSDGLARLAANDLGSPWEVQVAATVPKPRAWYRLGERVGPHAIDRIAGKTGVYFGTPSYGAASLVGDGDSSVTFDTSDDYVIVPGDAFPTQAPWTVTFTFMVPAIPAAGVIQILAFDANNYPNGLTVWLDSNGLISARVGNNGVYTYIRSGGFFGTIAPNISTQLTVQMLTAGPPYLRLRNGGQEMSDAATATGVERPRPNGYMVLRGSPNVATFDELLTFDGLPSDTALQDLDDAGGGWANRSAPNRIGVVLDAAGWTAARSITAQWDTNLKRTGLTESALSHLEKIVATAEGRLWVTRDGTLKILSRGEFAAPPYTESQGTFGDAPGELPYVGMGDYALDMASVENVSRRSWNDVQGNGTLYEASDFSASTLRRSGGIIESEYVAPDYEYDLAAFRVAKLAHPVPYVQALRISPRKVPTTLFPQVLGREISDRLTWIRRPQNVGAAISKEVIIEGVSHSFGPKRWISEFYIDATDAFEYFHFDETLWDAVDWRFIA